MAIQWEKIDAILERSRTPTGWLVRDTGGTPVVFVPDPDGTWLATTPPPVVVSPPPVTTKQLGTNLIGVDDYEPEQPFANRWRQSRAWISTDGVTWDDHRAIDVDTNGNVRSLLPGQKLRTLFYWALPIGAFPSGDHVLTWAGSGSFTTFEKAAVKTVGDHRLVLTVTGGFGLMLDNVNAADPPRNLSLIPLSNSNPIWSDPFLASLSPYKALRFMDWQRTNNSTIVNEVDLPATTRLRFTTGVPLEVCIGLCNQLHVRPWICIPHQATDATIQAMASRVKGILAADLGCIVEYSNEVWNTGFAQSAYAQAQGVALNLDPDPNIARMLFHALRSSQVATIFRAALGSRVTAVLGAQTEATWIMDKMLAAHPTTFDAVAIAPYFGGSLGSSTTTPTMTLDQLFATLGPIVDQTGPHVASAKAVAAKYNATLIGYEGGQHLVGIGALQDNAQLNALFDAANADPRMGALYTKYLAAWQTANPNALLCHYVNIGLRTKFGRWGSMISPYDIQAPKRLALVTYATVL